MNAQEYPLDVEAAIRARIMKRALAITSEIRQRFVLAAYDLEHGSHLAALGALDGLEAHLTIIRSLLRLID